MSYHAFLNLFRTIVANRDEGYASSLLGFRFDCTVVPAWREVFEVFAAAAERDFSISRDKFNSPESNWMSWYQACLRGTCDYRLEDDSMFSAEVEFTRTWFDASQAPGYRLQMGRDWGFSFGVDEEKVKDLTGLEEPDLSEENHWLIKNKFGVFVGEKGISIGEREMLFRFDLPATLHYLCELDLKIRQGGAKLSELVKPFQLEIIKNEGFESSEIKIPTAPGFICICDFRQGYFVLRNKYFDLDIHVLPTLERHDQWPLG